jgi:cell division protein FtsN
MKTGEREGATEGKRIEVQLDTAQILLVIAGLVGLCACAFYLGRAFERDRWKEATAAPRAQATKLAETDAGADLSFFDTLGKHNAEPTRQTSGSRPALQPPAPVTARVSPDTADGPASDEPAQTAAAPVRAAPTAPAPRAESGKDAFAVQVFAGDRSQAVKLSASLAKKGYASKVIEGSGSGAARVRVYGYRTKADAERGADRLRREEKLHPWVVKGD